MPKQTTYYFVNILTLFINCIDLEKSVYKLILPERPDILIFRYLEKLVLDTQKINHHIFRIKSLRTDIIISEFLKNKIQELKLQEITFQPTEEYQSNMWSKKNDD
jgi:hypothetical protein